MNQTREPLVRRRTSRVLAGVCAGLSRHLGIPVIIVRITMLVAAIFGGAGVLLYLWLWALLPQEGEDGSILEGAPRGLFGSATAAESSQGREGDDADIFVRMSRDLRDRYRRSPSLWNSLAVGLLLLLVTVGLIATRAGVDVPWAVILPLLALSIGLILVWGNLNEAERRQWRTRTGATTQQAAARLLGGLALVVVGIVFVVLAATSGTPVYSTIVAVFAVLAGIVLVLTPFAVRFSRRILTERAEAARTGERADIAAHLHDSVLQTLSLIRRRSNDPAEVARLARGQERELREWLYGEALIPEDSLADALRKQSGEIEDLYGVEIELVIVGDATSVEPETGNPEAEAKAARNTEQRSAILAAAREATINAAVHAGGPVSVYAEFGSAMLEVFVRDHGEGFDPDDVDESRHGVRDSIIGRMKKFGGSSSFRSTPSGGTEVRLTIQREEYSDR
ncbi:PspC domain-containing protein [Saxibacter everestensis]|uniref:PspC domain-containing protein n=1 Tax=Saxibacter everestensis TaxID=2909229 RepID=A0ABY8QSV3_9MICO|nr:PspC domain-containing protein [Brevibacteriaceae bacterium ZFBP1038]